MKKNPRQDGKIGLYAENEQWMFRFQAYKDKAFASPAKFLRLKGVHPNTLSITGALAAALVPAALTIGIIAPVLLIITHLIFDGTDGILARTCGLNSTSGSVVDTICDHVGIIFIALAIGIAFPECRLMLFLFVISYTLLIFPAYVMSIFEFPLKFMIRPRLFAFMADILCGGRTTFMVLTISAIILTIQVIFGMALMLKKISPNFCLSAQTTIKGGSVHFIFAIITINIYIYIFHRFGLFNILLLPGTGQERALISRESILFIEEKTMISIDLHTHSKYSTNKYFGTIGTCHPHRMIETAIQRGINIFSITDHDTIEGSLVGMEYVQQHELPIIFVPGVEVSSNEGHILAYGVVQDIPLGMSAKETISTIHEAGGIAVAAHPFNLAVSLNRRIFELELDGIEVFNYRCTGNRKALSVACQMRLGLTAGSDAHSSAEIGMRTYFVDKWPDNESEIPNFIKNNQFIKIGNAGNVRSSTWFSNVTRTFNSQSKFWGYKFYNGISNLRREKINGKTFT